MGGGGGTSKTCLAYKNGICNGNLINVPILTAPTSSTGCSLGVFGDFASSGSSVITYTWKCFGTGTGSINSNCTATQAVDGACGSAHNSASMIIDPPTGTAACSAGISTAVTGSGSTGWSWSCLPNGVGQTVSCSASIACGQEAGSICTDGTVYAGPTPDGGGPMFAMPCDLGQTGTLSGASYTCTGTRATYTWGTHGTTTGYTSNNTGKANTYGLVATYGTGVPAAKACRDQTYGGHNDWYLPALYELNYMCNGTTSTGSCTRAALIKNFDTSGVSYWSSTEGNTSYARNLRFSDGGQNSGTYKYNGYHVRCVRKP